MAHEPLMTALLKDEGRFFCMHRHDDGYLRVCAGWAAVFGDKPKSKSVGGNKQGIRRASNVEGTPVVETQATLWYASLR
jgi:hypothetical protein